MALPSRSSQILLAILILSELLTQEDRQDMAMAASQSIASRVLRLGQAQNQTAA
ncbi:MAG TPA: hypothetical protein V6C57_12020 [Coleofasciculaceae cyanobacterium]